MSSSVLDMSMSLAGFMRLHECRNAIEPPSARLTHAHIASTYKKPGSPRATRSFRPGDTLSSHSASGRPC